MIKQGLLSLGLAFALLLPQAFAEEEATDAQQEESVTLHVDINNDGVEKMADLLDGVGPARAEAIIEYRDENGPFIAPEDLMNVSGIGPATLENNRDRIELGMTDE